MATPIEIARAIRNFFRPGGYASGHRDVPDPVIKLHKAVTKNLPNAFTLIESLKIQVRLAYGVDLEGGTPGKVKGPSIKQVGTKAFNPFRAIDLGLRAVNTVLISGIGAITPKAHKADPDVSAQPTDSSLPAIAIKVLLLPILSLQQLSATAAKYTSPSHYLKDKKTATSNKSKSQTKANQSTPTRASQDPKDSANSTSVEQVPTPRRTSDGSTAKPEDQTSELTTESDVSVAVAPIELTESTESQTPQQPTNRNRSASLPTPALKEQSNTDVRERAASESASKAKDNASMATNDAEAISVASANSDKASVASTSSVATNQQQQTAIDNSTTTPGLSDNAAKIELDINNLVQKVNSQAVAIEAIKALPQELRTEFERKQKLPVPQAQENSLNEFIQNAALYANNIKVIYDELAGKLNNDIRVAIRETKLSDNDANILHSRITNIDGQIAIAQAAVKNLENSIAQIKAESTQFLSNRDFDDQIAQMLDDSASDEFNDGESLADSDDNMRPADLLDVTAIKQVAISLEQEIEDKITELEQNCQALDNDSNTDYINDLIDRLTAAQSKNLALEADINQAEQLSEETIMQLLELQASFHEINKDIKEHNIELSSDKMEQFRNIQERLQQFSNKLVSLQNNTGAARFNLALEKVTPNAAQDTDTLEAEDTSSLSFTTSEPIPIRERAASLPTPKQPQDKIDIDKRARAKTINVAASASVKNANEFDNEIVHNTDSDRPTGSVPPSKTDSKPSFTSETSERTRQRGSQDRDRQLADQMAVQQSQTSTAKSEDFLLGALNMLTKPMWAPIRVTLWKCFTNAYVTDRTDYADEKLSSRKKQFMDTVTLHYTGAGGLKGADLKQSKISVNYGLGIDAKTPTTTKIAKYSRFLNPLRAVRFITNVAYSLAAQGIDYLTHEEGIRLPKGETRSIAPKSNPVGIALKSLLLPVYAISRVAGYASNYLSPAFYYAEYQAQKQNRNSQMIITGDTEGYNEQQKDVGQKVSAFETGVSEISKKYSLQALESVLKSYDTNKAKLAKNESLSAKKAQRQFEALKKIYALQNPPERIAALRTAYDSINEEIVKSAFAKTIKFKSFDSRLTHANQFLKNAELACSKTHDHDDQFTKIRDNYAASLTKFVKQDYAGKFGTLDRSKKESIESIQEELDYLNNTAIPYLEAIRNCYTDNAVNAKNEALQNASSNLQTFIDIRDKLQDKLNDKKRLAKLKKSGNKLGDKTKNDINTESSASEKITKLNNFTDSILNVSSVYIRNTTEWSEQAVDQTRSAEVARQLDNKIAEGIDLLKVLQPEGHETADNDFMQAYDKAAKATSKALILRIPELEFDFEIIKNSDKSFKIYSELDQPQREFVNNTHNLMSSYSLALAKLESISHARDLGLHKRIGQINEVLDKLEEINPQLKSTHSSSLLSPNAALQAATEMLTDVNDTLAGAESLAIEKVYTTQDTASLTTEVIQDVIAIDKYNSTVDKLILALDKKKTEILTSTEPLEDKQARMQKFLTALNNKEAESKQRFEQCSNIADKNNKILNDLNIGSSESTAGEEDIAALKALLSECGDKFAIAEVTIAEFEVFAKNTRDEINSQLLQISAQTSVKTSGVTIGSDPITVNVDTRTATSAATQAQSQANSSPTQDSASQTATAPTAVPVVASSARVQQDVSDDEQSTDAPTEIKARSDAVDWSNLEVKHENTGTKELPHTKFTYNSKDFKDGFSDDVRQTKSGLHVRERAFLLDAVKQIIKENIDAGTAGAKIPVGGKDPLLVNEVCAIIEALGGEYTLKPGTVAIDKTKIAVRTDYYKSDFKLPTAYQSRDTITGPGAETEAEAEQLANLEPIEDKSAVEEELHDIFKEHDTKIDNLRITTEQKPGLTSGPEFI